GRTLDAVLLLLCSDPQVITHTVATATPYPLGSSSVCTTGNLLPSKSKCCILVITRSYVYEDPDIVPGSSVFHRTYYFRYPAALAARAPAVRAQAVSPSPQS